MNHFLMWLFIRIGSRWFNAVDVDKDKRGMVSRISFSRKP